MKKEYLEVKVKVEKEEELSPYFELYAFCSSELTVQYN
jgi:hypothetical protein